MLRLPTARPLALGFLRTTVTSLTPFLSLASGSWSCSRCAWALVYRSRHMLRFFLQEEASRISQVPRVPFRAFALLSDPGRISTPSLLRRFDSAPAVQTTKAPTSGHYFEAQSHGFSSRSIRFVPGIAADYAMFASGWWPAFAGWDSLPTGSLYCVSESCFLFDYMLFLTFWVYLTRLQLLTSLKLDV